MSERHKFFKVLIFCWLASTVIANHENQFPNFFCGENEKLSAQKCEVRNIFSASDLQRDFDDLEDFDFYYGTFYSLTRNDITKYNELEFKDSKFEKFPTGSFPRLSHIKFITAENVGLSKLNWDSFTSFQSLELLELSHNNITTLGNNVLSYLESLTSLNLSYNQIENISKYAFNQCSVFLRQVDFSHNKIKTIDVHILDTLGANAEAILYLEFNNIEEITNSLASEEPHKKFELLDLSYNKLKKFDFTCEKINELRIRDNLLEEAENSHCEINRLDIRNNSLTYLKLFNVSELYISDNKNLKNVSLNFESLKRLKAANIPSKTISYDFLQNASQLIELDASNTFLGTPKIGMFSKMKFLEDLKLRNTGLSHIEYGMFGHQSNIKNFDISYNNLGHLDIEMLSSMKALESLDISGNYLTNFKDVSDFKRNFPNLILIGIEENNWNCSYLSKILKFFLENSISIKEPVVPVTSSSHISEIGCTNFLQKIKPIDADNAKDLVLQKLNEIIEEINAEKVDNNNAKYDSDIIKTNLSHLEHQFNEMKSKLLKGQITEVINNKNDSIGADIAVIKHVEQLNNLTLDKQKLENDQLELKIDQISKFFSEFDKFMQKNSMKDYHFSNQEQIKYENLKSSNENNSGAGATNILLAIVMTILAVIGVVFGYTKLKNLFYRRYETPSVLARSTNTLNTTIEIPFDDRKF